MSVVYSNDYLKIVEEKNKIFKIILDYPNAVLINSLLKTRIIQGGTSTDNYKILKFKANSIKSLQQFQEEKKKERGKKQLNMNETALLIKTLSNQLNYLINYESHTIIGYAPENIIVINDKNFVFLGSELLSKIEDQMVLLSFPFTTNDFFLSPELLKIKELPAYVHYKVAYFSLGCLVLYTILTDDEFYINYLKDEKDEINVDNLLKSHTIKNTKLYWLLSRCLIKDVTKRTILFI
jgi:hypothetical protein